MSLIQEYDHNSCKTRDIFPFSIATAITQVIQYQASVDNKLPDRMLE